MKQMRLTRRSALMLLAAITVLAGCSSSQQPNGGQQEAASLPVIQVKTEPATSYKEFPASLEGKVNVEIRPQVDGYLEDIYVDEGAWVQQGQNLFRINDHSYREQSSNAAANLAAAKANLSKAELEVERLRPLVQNNVVSDVQLKTAESVRQAAAASVAQAKAMVGNAEINVGYTLIKAPVSGYIGKIPYKKGSLVGRNEPMPLTVLSDIQQMYAYFSMTETEFFEFRKNNPNAGGNKDSMAVELMLPDNTMYSAKGKIEAIEGQFDKNMGTISLRATFPNPDKLLRTGNTGRIRVPSVHESALLLPQEATFEMQDKILVFTVSSDNKVLSKPITVSDKIGNYYVVSDGLKAGDRVVFSGLDRLKDSTTIKPQLLSMDSLLKANPLHL